MTFKSAGTGLSRNLLLVRLKEKTSSHEICFFNLPPTVSGALTSFEEQNRGFNIENQVTCWHLTAPKRANNTFFKKPKQTSCLLACRNNNMCINLLHSTVFQTIYGAC